jgi:hypothetical protein
VLQASSSRTCLVHDDGGSTSGDYTVEQFISLAPYAHIYYASPTTNSTIADMADDCNVILGSWSNSWWYNETANQWTAPTSLAYPLTPGKGFYQYTWVGTNGKIFDFKGPLTTGPVSIPITNTGGNGWNIVGNPYSSPIDLDSLYALGSNPPVTYRYNKGSYVTYNAATGISTDLSFGNIAPIMQGFWVYTAASTTMDFSNNMRITDPTTSVDAFTKHSFPVLRLAMRSQTDTMNSVVYFYNGATEAYDGLYDGYYLDGDKTIQFATKTGTDKLSINALPELTLSDVTIPLHTEISAIGNYSIALTEFSDFPSGSKLILQDLLLSISRDLTKNDYSYYGNPINGNDRFIITLLPNTVNTDPVEDATTFKVFKSNKNLCISLPEVIDENRTIKIYNVLGQTLHTSTLEKGQQLFNISNLNLPDENVYFVDIEGFDIASKIVW